MRFSSRSTEKSVLKSATRHFVSSRASKLKTALKRNYLPRRRVPTQRSLANDKCISDKCNQIYINFPANRVQADLRSEMVSRLISRGKRVNQPRENRELTSFYDRPEFTFRRKERHIRSGITVWSRLSLITSGDRTMHGRVTSADWPNNRRVTRRYPRCSNNCKFTSHARNGASIYLRGISVRHQARDSSKTGRLSLALAFRFSHRDRRRNSHNSGK